MRFAKLLIALVLVVFRASSSFCDAVSPSVTEVVTLDQLAERTSRFSEKYPDSPFALLELGRAYLFAYVNDQYYFPLVVDPGALPPWSLQEECLVPVYRNELQRRRPGDETEHLVNAIQTLRSALARESGHLVCQVTLAFAYLEAAGQGGAVASLRDDSFPNEDVARVDDQEYWRSLAVGQCRDALAGGASEDETPGSEIRDYANAMVCYVMSLQKSRTAAEAEVEERACGGIGSNEARSLFQELTNSPPQSDPSPEAMASVEQSYPPVPPVTNGALIYLDAADAYVEPRGKYASIREIVNDEIPETSLALIDHEHVAIMGEFLDANETCFDLVRQAGACGSFRYPIDFKGLASLSSWHTFEIRKLSRLLRVQALYASLAGDGNQAQDSILASVTLTNSLVKEPVLISQLVRNGLGGTTLQALEQVMSRIALTDEQLQRFQRVIAMLDNRNSLRAALEGERWRLNLPISDADLQGPAIAVGRIVQDDRTPEQLREFRKRMEADRTLALAQVDACLGRIDAPWDQLYRLAGSQLDSANRMNPAHGRSMISFITNVARVRTAQVGLAVKRYQLRNGNFPASLEALAPEFLQEETLSDPFDGKSLRWAVLVDRYVVYSIGDPRLNERAKSYDVAALSSVTFTVAK